MHFKLIFKTAHSRRNTCIHGPGREDQVCLGLLRELLLMHFKFFLNSIHGPDTHIHGPDTRLRMGIQTPDVR